MTANEIVLRFVLLLLALLGVACVVWLFRRKKKKDPALQTHQPHSPDAGNDAAAMARSKMEGLGPNFMT